MVIKSAISTAGQGVAAVLDELSPNAAATMQEDEKQPEVTTPLLGRH